MARAPRLPSAVRGRLVLVVHSLVTLVGLGAQPSRGPRGVRQAGRREPARVAAGSALPPQRSGAVEPAAAGRRGAPASSVRAGFGVYIASFQPHGVSPARLSRNLLPRLRAMCHASAARPAGAPCGRGPRSGLFQYRRQSSERSALRRAWLFRRRLQRRRFAARARLRAIPAAGPTAFCLPPLVSVVVVGAGQFLYTLV